MKKKIYKILGVALTLVMVLSLFAFTAAPVAADPDENEWSKFELPDQGSDGDWFYDDDIWFVGPMALAINGDLYAYAYVNGAEFAELEFNGSYYIDSNIFKSDDGGRTWATTDFADELVEDDYGYVVDIVCDSEDADIVYVATLSYLYGDGYVYWSEDGGDTFDAMAPDSLDEARDEEGYWGCITSLDATYFGGDAYVFVSTAWDGGAYYINLETYLVGWTDMGLWAYGDDGQYDAYAINCAPDFDDSRKVYALVCDGSETQIVVNSGTSGVWSQFGDNLLEALPDDDLAIEWGSNICFPDDFDHDELLVGVDGDGDVGSVYRVTADPDAAYRLEIDDDGADIISLEVTGDIGATLLLAGAEGDAEVFYSTDDGEEWDAAGKPPTGEFWTYVLMAEDFADSGEAWAATSGDECAVSYTIDSGDLWNQISLIGTDIERIRDVSFYPDYEASEKMFLMTCDALGAGDDSLWRYDGEYWERVAEEKMLAGVVELEFWEVDMHLVQVSPEIGSDDTVYFSGHTAIGGDARIFRSDDLGQSWDELKCHPDNLYTWIVIDDDTVIAGGVDSDGDGIGSIYKTTNHGTRVWDEIEVDGDAGTIVYFAWSGDELLCGDAGDGDTGESRVFISEEELGEEWEMVGEEIVNAAGDAVSDNTFVAFDTDYADNDMVYAASGDAICSFEVDESDDWESIVYDADGDAFDIGVASGIATADGCLYVSDSDGGVGMWRSVNPTDDAEDVLFEQVAFELDDDAELYRLRTTTHSNVLWALDLGWDDDADPEASLENALWTYEDALVGPVELDSPADGEGIDRTNKLILTWEELADADDYEVMCYADEDFRAAFEVWDGDIDNGELLILTEADGIESGTAYWWKVRVEPGEPLASKWSVVWSATTAMGAAQWNPFRGPVNEYPWMGATGVPIKPTFAWNVADWATGYEFVLADNDAFSDAFTKELTTTVYQYETELDYFATYYWKVRAVSATGTSNWATGVFTTMEKPAEIVAPPPPVEIPPLPAPITPAWIWAIVVIGAVLVIAVIILIVLTRRVP